MFQVIVKTVQGGARVVLANATNTGGVTTRMAV